MRSGETTPAKHETLVTFLIPKPTHSSTKTKLVTLNHKEGTPSLFHASRGNACAVQARLGDEKWVWGATCHAKSGFDRVGLLGCCSAFNESVLIGTGRLSRFV